MTVLGIDVGHQESHLVWWDGERVERCETLPNIEAEDVLQATDVEIVAVETPTLFGKRVYPAIMETAVQAGVFMGIAGATIAGACVRRQVRRYSRQETSLHCAGDRSCGSTKLKHCLIERFGPVGVKKNPGPLYGLVKTDHFDALAVAVTAYDKAAEGGS